MKIAVKAKNTVPARQIRYPRVSEEVGFVRRVAVFKVISSGLLRERSPRQDGLAGFKPLLIEWLPPRALFGALGPIAFAAPAIDGDRVDRGALERVVGVA